ncbi:MATE family efflux transporter [Alkaliphilus hydrothermalis]|uniref:Multidrug export protein MepA n=1 Tax=Alkaliphilus hydrothermalis TaxID=1482730 RepID=A0ABS2NMF0_9FIRM|nr:MATE family efflux transporter [Alkaliphilus hydrothermalis]MBM7614082.1 putative MATE family efflux protein [Alkaliphilus hydrothermalis]
MNEHSKMLATERIGKLLIKLSAPAMLGMMVQAIYNLVDTIFVGRGVGKMAIAGLTIAFPIQMLVMAVAQTIGIGGASIISRSLGKGDLERAEKTMGNMMSLTVVISLLIAVFGSIFIVPILKFFGATETILPYSVDYMRIIIWGTLFFTFAMTSNNIIRAEGNAKVAMITMLISAGLNIILDPIFIFVFDMGIGGAALATVLAQATTVVYLVYYFIKGKSTVKLKVQNLRFNKSIILETFAIGSSSFARQASGSITAVILNNSLAYYGGDAAIAIYGVINRLMMFTFLPLIGVVQGFLPIVGFNYGANLMDRVKQSINLSVIVTTIMSVGGFLMLMLFPRFFFSIFNEDPKFIEDGIVAMRYIILALPVIGFQVIGASLFQAFGKAKPSLFLNLSRQILFLIPLVLILPLYFQLNGLWLAFPLADLLAFIVTLIMVIRQMRHLNEAAALEQ